MKTMTSIKTHWSFIIVPSPIYNSFGHDNKIHSSGGGDHLSQGKPVMIYCFNSIIIGSAFLASVRYIQCESSMMRPSKIIVPISWSTVAIKKLDILTHCNMINKSTIKSIASFQSYMWSHQKKWKVEVREYFCSVSTSYCFQSDSCQREFTCLQIT